MTHTPLHRAAGGVGARFWGDSKMMRLLFGTLIDLGPVGTGQNVTIDDATPYQMQSWWYDVFYRDVFRGQSVVTLDDMFQRCGRKFKAALVTVLFPGKGANARQWHISDEDVALVVAAIKPRYSVDDWRYSQDASVILSREFADWRRGGEARQITAWPPGEYFAHRAVRMAIDYGQCDLLVGRVRFVPAETATT